MAEQSFSWNFKEKLAVGVSLLALAGAAYGVYCAIHSPLFYFKRFEIEGLEDRVPLSKADVIGLTRLESGQVSLFDINLELVATQLEAHPWVKEVQIQKELPDTLRIKIFPKRPVAVHQSLTGKLSYIDRDGLVFDEYRSAGTFGDLPLISGIAPTDQGKIQSVLSWMREWTDRKGLSKISEISMIHWDDDAGFRAMILYPLPSARQVVRASLEIGQNIDIHKESRMPQMERVIEYLVRNSISVRQIRADDAKKMVVKTARRS